MVALTHSSFVPLVAQPGKEDAVTEFLVGGHGLVLSEPLTLQWYAVKYHDTTPAQFAIFDTFPSEEGRNAHFTGPIPAALMENAPKLLIGAPKMEEIMADVISHHVTKAGEGQKAGVTTGLRVFFTAKPGKKEAVRAFLAGAVPIIEKESDTVAWYSIHWPGTDNFGAVALFKTEEAREAHLKDHAATALIGSADENLTAQPDVVRFDVLAAKAQAGIIKDTLSKRGILKAMSNTRRKTIFSLSHSMTAKASKQPPHVYHPQFNSPDADIILVSSEETGYRVPHFTLRNTCGYFRGLLAGHNSSLVHPEADRQEVIDVDEKDKVLTKVLSMICGLHTENWESIDEADDALLLAQKWDAPGPLSIIRGAITAPIFLAEPLRLYAIATRLGWDEEAKLASTHTLTLDLYEEVNGPALERISTGRLMTVFRLHRERRDLFKSLIDSDDLFEAGNSGRYVCPGCGEQMSNHTWRELKARMFMEMDRRPLGDTLCSLEMEEWAEATACWEAKCQKADCGRLNYNKLSTLRDIKSCLDRLPSHV
ncbi:hypothetical protein GALMADRAFT_213710 [Galerina marginata CBS 339.88]|uniref:ABM domain-containing protein n=1 Tax=Galerina marginata (strain CBS 339.88) TaxID=685588 RepID=A0A067SLR9_GALM3|nr:hypothetical protein GALMADRAFT_213710 [Galerina marginata CBS 339.88]